MMVKNIYLYTHYVNRFIGFFWILLYTSENSKKNFWIKYLIEYCLALKSYIVKRPPFGDLRRENDIYEKDFIALAMMI